MANADIYRWDNGEMIPGTEGIEPGPGFTFSGNLAYADLSESNLANATLRDTILTEADLSGAILSNAVFNHTQLANADFSGANLKGASIHIHDDGLLLATLDSETVYNQWTEFPQNFDPVAEGLKFFLQPRGDFDSNDALDVGDIDHLSRFVCCVRYHNEVNLDLNSNSDTDIEDVWIWVKEIKNTYFGDANLDGEFNATDLFAVLSAGEYEDGIDRNSQWATGDWNADREFTSADLLVSLADRGYGQGPRATIAAVPEPATFFTLLVGLIAIASVSRIRRTPT